MEIFNKYAYIVCILFKIFIFLLTCSSHFVNSYANSDGVSTSGAGDYVGCVNNCNGHGSCTVFGFCKCFRYCGAPDCSQRLCPFGFAMINSGGRDINIDGDKDDATDINLSPGSKSSVPGSMVCQERIFTTEDNAACTKKSAETCVQTCSYLNKYPTKDNKHGKYGRGSIIPAEELIMSHGYEAGCSRLDATNCEVEYVEMLDSEHKNSKKSCCQLVENNVGKSDAGIVRVDWLNREVGWWE